MSLRGTDRGARAMHCDHGFPAEVGVAKNGHDKAKSSIVCSNRRKVQRNK